MSNRYLHNTAIVGKLQELIQQYPEFRFHQLLWAMGLTERDEYGTIDKFYEESDETWDKLKLNEFTFPCD